MPGEVATTAEHSVVVKVLEAERLALGNVEQRGEGERVGGQPVRLHAQLHAEVVGPAAQREQVVVPVQVGQHLVEVVADVRGELGVVAELVLALELHDDRQERRQVIAGAGRELGRQRRRPDRRLRLDLQRVFEERTAGLPQQPADPLVQDALLPEVGDRSGPRGAEVIDDVEVGVVNGPASGCCAEPRIQ